MDEHTYLVIDESTSEIVNIVIWDGKSKWAPPKGCRAYPASAVEVIRWVLSDEDNGYIKKTTIGDAYIGYVWRDGHVEEKKPDLLQSGRAFSLSDV